MLDEPQELTQDLTGYDTYARPHEAGLTRYDGMPATTIRESGREAHAAARELPAKS